MKDIKQEIINESYSFGKLADGLPNEKNTKFGE